MKKTTVFLALFLLSCSLSAELHWPARIIECSIQPIDRSKIHPSDTSTTSQSVSENWSGYVAAKSFTGSSADETVTAVSGNWSVPVLTSTGKSAYCAIWVGIDGYLSDTVEQIGTSHNWVNGAQQNYAWFEMYPTGAYEIVGFPVNRGDVISAQVTYQGSNVFLLQITNQTRRVSTTIPTSYTTSSSALRSSAEWIVEAPYSGAILPLADFKAAAFTQCAATINGIHGPINNSNWQNSEITMESSRGALESRPSALTQSGAAFQVTWEKQ